MNDKITNELVEHKDTPKKPEVSLIVKIMMYLYNMKIPFSARHGLKKMYYFHLRDPITKDIIKEMKEFFELVKYAGYSSGEYPYIENPEEYDYLNFVDFNDTCSSFIVTKKEQSDFINNIEYNLHLKAYDIYKTLHYPGSVEEAQDKALVEKMEIQIASEQSEYARKEALDELEAERNLLDLVLAGGLDGELTDGTYILPDGATWEIVGSYIQLTITRLDAFITILESGLYKKANERNPDFCVKYTVKAKFDFWNFSVLNTKEKNEELLLEVLGKFDNHSLENLEVLKLHSIYPMHKVDYETVDTPEYCSNYRKAHMDMIEEYFEKKGLKGKPKISQKEKDKALDEFFEKRARERRFDDFYS